MTETKKEILVWVLNPDLAAEHLTKARLEANAVGGQVSALVGADLDFNPGEFGADRVYQVPTNSFDSPEASVAVLSKVIGEVKPAIVLVPANKLGLQVAPRVAERTQGGYVAWILDFGFDGDDVKVQMMLFGGIGKSALVFHSQPVIMSVTPGVIEASQVPGYTPAVTLLEFEPVATRIQVLAVQPKTASGTRLEDANFVLDIGQGVEGSDGLALMRSFSEQLGGQLACSRPVSSEKDWFPEWLGLSGIKISPELCLAVGVSGQIQHMVGIRNSRVIAAVNNDENAPIFTQADYGVIADLNEFIPCLAERIKARSVKLAE